MPLELMLLRARIEKMRRKMIQLAAVKGSLVDAEVVEVSKKLDMLLVNYQKMRF